MGAKNVMRLSESARPEAGQPGLRVVSLETRTTRGANDVFVKAMSKPVPSGSIVGIVSTLGTMAAGRRPPLTGQPGSIV